MLKYARRRYIFPPAKVGALQAVPMESMKSRTVRQTCIEGGFEAFSRLLCFQPYALVFFPYNLNDDLPMGALQGGYPRIQWARRV